MIRFAENLNKMITAGLGGALEAPSTEVAVGHRVVYTEVSGDVASFETNVIAPVKNLRVTMEPIQAGSGDPSPENIRPITGRDSVTVWREASYNPSADPALTIQLGDTVYGGTLDVVSGELVIDRAMVDLGTLNWISDEYASGQFRVNQSEIKPLNPKYSSYVQCSILKGVEPKSYSAFDNGEIGLSNSPTDPILRARSETFTGKTAKEIKAIMQGQQLVYELATPQTLTLDPATLSTLKGDNNVWSDAGNISLEYPYYEETEGY